MNKLIKKIETPTDFSICIFQSQKTGRFAVTTYDIVSQKHEDAQWYATKEEAMAEAKDRAKGYRMNESKQTIRLNEADLRNLIKEALNEKLGGQKLAQFAQQHGGINSKFSSQYNDLANMRDEEFSQYIPVDQQRFYDDIQNGKIETNNSQAQPLAFNDGTFLVKRSSTWGNNQGYQNMIQKQNDRIQNRQGDFLQKKQNTLNRQGTLRNMYQQNLKPEYQNGGMTAVNQFKQTVSENILNKAITRALKKLLK